MVISSLLMCRLKHLYKMFQIKICIKIYGVEKI